MSDRNTQFAGFAKLLWDELPDPPDDNSLLGFDEWSAACEQVIARRAYDLVKHTLNFSELPVDDYFKPSDLLDRVPDLTQWTEEVHDGAN